MQYKININCNRTTSQELISRVFQRKEEAEKVLQEFNNKNLIVPFKAYVTHNKSNSGYYVCYFTSRNKDRIKEWYQWLSDKGVVCYLVRS